MPDYLDKNSDEFGTPDYIFGPLDREFHFVRDVAASDRNHKVSRYFTKEDNALEQDWGDPGDTVWCNPPYSRGNVEAFARKADAESTRGVTTVMLVPARVEQPWFHDLVLSNPHNEVRFIKGRVKYNGGKTSARFPSMLVIFRPWDGFVPWSSLR
jgi:site-specific DNA-methyltransferase (adenine-specific)